MEFHAKQRMYHVKLSEVNEVLNQTPGDVQLRIASTTLVVNDDGSMIRPVKQTNTTVPIYLATALPRNISLTDIKIMFLTLDYPKEFRAIFGAGERAMLEDFTQMHEESRIETVKRGLVPKMALSRTPNTLCPLSVLLAQPCELPSEIKHLVWHKSGMPVFKHYVERRVQEVPLTAGNDPRPTV